MNNGKIKLEFLTQNAEHETFQTFQTQLTN